jgi:hypothetical protein
VTKKDTVQGILDLVPSTDTTSIQNDISLIALQTAINGNLSAYGLKNSFIEQFEDSTKIEALSSVARVDDGEYMASVYTAPGTPSYGTGDETSNITCTTNNISLSSGALQNWLDGNSGTNWVWGNGSTVAVDSYLRFQFSATQLVTESKWYHGNTSDPLGVWQWQGSNDLAGSWTNIGAEITVSGLVATSPFVSTVLNANTTSYIYYQLLSKGTVGTNSNNTMDRMVFQHAAGDSATYGYGYAGGESVHGGGNASGAGGGGGAGAAAPNLGDAGEANSSTGGGDGGVGKELTIFNRWGTTTANVATSGTDGGWFAGGGGGGVYTCPNDAAGGKGGGGDGKCTSTVGDSGLVNTGGGGASSGNTSANGAGGSGIVLIRRPTSNIVPGANLTLQSVANTALTSPTTGDIVMLIENASGTAVLGTNIKVFVSRNGGAAWDEATGSYALADKGTWGSGTKKIITANGIPFTGAAGTDMRYKITTHAQNAGTMETRIHATSLAWA